MLSPPGSSGMEDIGLLVQQSRQEQQIISQKLSALENLSTTSGWPPLLASSSELLSARGGAPLDIFTALDTNRDGVLTRQEFAQLASASSSPPTLRGPFAPDPGPSSSPLLSGHGAGDVASSSQAQDLLFSKFDTNRDGSLSRQEFNKGMAERQGLPPEPLKDFVQSEPPARHDRSVLPPPAASPSPSLSPRTFKDGGLSSRRQSPIRTAMEQQPSPGTMGVDSPQQAGAKQRSGKADPWPVVGRRAPTPSWRRDVEEWRALQAQLAGMDHALLERDHEIEKLREEIKRLRSQKAAQAAPLPSKPFRPTTAAELPDLDGSSAKKAQELVALRNHVGQLEAEAALRDAQRERLFEDASTVREKLEAAERQCRHLQERLQGLEEGFARCVGRVSSSLAAGVVRVSVRRSGAFHCFAVLRALHHQCTGVLELYKEPDDPREAASVELLPGDGSSSVDGLTLFVNCKNGPIELQCSGEADLQKWAAAFQHFRGQPQPAAQPSPRTPADDMFSKIDANKDGVITRQEFAAAFRPAPEKELTRSSYSPMHRSPSGGSVVMPYGVYNKEAGSPRNPNRLCGEGVSLLSAAPRPPPAGDVIGQEVARSIRQFHTPEQAIFDMLDRNRDGVLTRSELRPGAVAAAAAVVPSTAAAGFAASPDATSIEGENTVSGINSLEGWFAEYGSPTMLNEVEKWPAFRKPLEVWPPAEATVGASVDPQPSGILVDEASSHRLLRGPDSPEVGRTAGLAGDAGGGGRPMPTITVPVIEYFPGEQEIMSELKDILNIADVNRTESLTKTEILTLRGTAYEPFASWVTDSRRFPAFDHNRSGSIEKQELGRALWIYRHSPDAGMGGGEASAPASGGESPFRLGTRPSQVGRPVQFFARD